MILPNAYSMDTIPQNFIHETISIQGIIGCGKSTFINILRSKEDKLKKIFGKPVIFVDEPVNEWNNPIYDNNTKSALDVFYYDIFKHGFTFQILAFTTRLEYLYKETSKITESSICIQDRSMLSDKKIFFANLKDHITQLEWDTYNRFYDLVCKDFNKTEKRMIYIESTPEECIERIKSRDAKGDSKIELPYLQSHDVLHKKMIEDFIKEGGIVYRFNWPFLKDKTQLDKYVDDFLDTIK